MDKSVVKAILALGGNIGDVPSAFERALHALTHCPRLAILKRSSLYRTKAWGLEDQPDFWNMAVLITTDLGPYDLLDICGELEQQAGRQRLQKWGPRTLDLDILTYGDMVLDEEKLTLPHPHAHERSFVLLPLRDISPTLRLRGKSVEEWWQCLKETGDEKGGGCLVNWKSESNPRDIALR